MNRRSFLQNTALTFGVLSLANQNLLSGLFEDPWKIKMLTDNLGIFIERGGTIGFLLSKSGIVVVDSQFPEQSKHLMDELKKRILSAGQPGEAVFQLLINTHHHGDHTAGNISFKGIVANVLAHENSLINQIAAAQKNKSEDKQLYPDLTYNYTWGRNIDKEKIRMHYFGAAHTNGDSFVQFENANIVHCGDLVFNRRHPFVDRPGGANMKNWIDVLNIGINKFDSNTTYIFGHAGTGYEVTGKADDLRAFQDYLGNVLKFTEGEIKAGKTKEEVLKTTLIPGSEEWKTDGILRPLEAAYDELTSK
ncbi:MAG: MBL fold metallo-hydrolase [Bacteroidota bacterium]|nr:MBL fold metallo-hydrolase [Bacteroidota bacterium]